MMPTIELTKENFAQELEKNGTLLIDWWAAWCGPCRAFGPIYEEAANKNPDIVFGKIDTEAQPELAAAFNIMSIPTLMVFREKVLLFAQPGMLPAAVLDDLIGKVRQLDMAEVHKEIAAHEAEGEKEAPK
jgi:thioredoxin 1